MSTFREELERIAKDAAAQQLAAGFTLEEFEEEWLWYTDTEKKAYLMRFDAPWGSKASRMQRASVELAAQAILTERFLEPLLEHGKVLELELGDLQRKEAACRGALEHTLSSIETIWTSPEELAARRREKR